MGPESAKSFKGTQIVPLPADDRRSRAPQEADYGRRGHGYIFGAFMPHDGQSFTEAYKRRTIVNWVDFLCRVDGWIPDEIERVFGILDNLNVHRATDVLLFLLAHPRWEFLFQPTSAP